MVMEDVTNSFHDKANEKWMSDGLEAVKLSFLHNYDDASTAPQYAPDMIYQHFGDSEKIFGYEDLDVKLQHTDQTLYAFADMSFSKKFKAEKGLDADEVIEKLFHQDVRKNALCQTKAEFVQKLEEQKKSKPFGEVVHKFEANGKFFALHKVTEISEDFYNFMERLQTLAMYFIESCNLTDARDEKFKHYLLYEVRDSGEGDGQKISVIAGYVLLYEYFKFPDQKRPRIAQVMLLPQYRKCGMGAKFLESLLGNLRADPTVFDVTVESPGDAFILLRDYVDCIACVNLPEFAPEKLKRGFKDEMRKAALKNFKITASQARRVYEILRYRVTNLNDKAEHKEQRLDVKRRMHTHVKRGDKDWKRLNMVLTRDELRQAVCSEMDPDAKMANLAQAYDHLMDEYQQVIDRMEKYPSIF